MFIESQVIYNIVSVSGIQHSDSYIHVRVCVYYINGASLLAQTVKNPPAMQEKQVQSLGWEDPLEEEMAMHSSYSCLGNPMDRGDWRATVHGVAKSRTE